MQRSNMREVDQRYVIDSRKDGGGGGIRTHVAPFGSQLDFESSSHQVQKLTNINNFRVFQVTRQPLPYQQLTTTHNERGH
jgi:hypothetical protein